ncbi:MAG: hypothetical protein D6722_00310 [Bacteroidetes bacterium]|nr:MAG: hypothetical protein D6722_00310 [Bacteroidota bacterium]
MGLFPRRATFAALFLLLLPSLSAQDSLRTLIRNSAGMVRFEWMYRLAQEIGPDSLAEAQTLLHQARELAEASGDYGAIARTCLAEGDLLVQHQRGLEDRQQAINQYLEAITNCQQIGDRACLAEGHFKAGRGYIVFQESEQALLNLFKALSLYQGLRDTAGMVAANAYLGFVFQMTGAPEEAISYETEALELARLSGADSMQAFILLNIGTFHLEREEYPVAESYLQEALAVGGDHMTVRDRVGTLNRLGAALRAQHKYPEARARFAQALQVAKLGQDDYARADTYLELATLHEQQKAYEQAMAYLDSSLNLAKAGGYDQLFLANYRVYQNVLLEMGNYDQFRYVRERYESLRDSIEGLELRRSLLRQEILYQKRQQEDALRIQAAELAAGRVQLFSAVVVGILLLVLALVLYRQYQHKRKINLRLEEQVKARTRELAEANEELDTFAYRTAHDFRGPVARLMGLCNLLLDDPTGPVAATYMDMLKRESVGMDHMLRRFMDVNNIKRIEPREAPVVLRQMVTEVLEDLRDEEFPMDAQLEIDIEPEATVRTHPDLLKVILKNIIGNALVYRQGKGTHEVHIMARTDKNTVRIRVRDNGIGIHPNVAPRIFEMFYRGTEQSTGLGLGLYATHLAADKLGAEVRYVTENEHETEFSVVFPYKG